MPTWIYSFVESDPRNKKDILGGKGANLATIWQMGAPVPEGFIIPTSACNHFLETNDDKEIWIEVLSGLAALESDSGCTLGDEERPLLLSVRSGAPTSMPGIMETFLNIGMTEQLIPVFNAKSASLGDELFQSLESRFRTFSNGNQLPSDARSQLREAIRLVMQSWTSSKARTYRAIYGLPNTGTAVVVQRMVLGLGECSGTGIAVTRDIKLGKKQLTGEYLPNEQGFSLVDGTKTPQILESLRKISPPAFEKLRVWSEDLERTFRFAQEIEFTVENGELWILQTRDIIPHSFAAVRIAVDLHREKIIETRRAALDRVDLGQLQDLASFKALDLQGIGNDHLLGYGVSQLASAARGHIALDASTVRSYARAGKECILISESAHLDTEQLVAMTEASGLLTALGGMTCHAATVATLRGKAHLVGCSNLTVDVDTRTVKFGHVTLHEGDLISFDGVTEQVFKGGVPFARIEADARQAVDRMLEWAKELSLISVWASADYRNSVDTARQFKLDVLDRWSFAPFVSSKAKAAYILAIIPDKHRIVQTPIPAYERDQLREAMEAVIRAGFWVGLRTGCEPQPLGSSPWAMGVKSYEDIRIFFNEVYDDWLRSVPYESGREYPKYQVGSHIIVQDGPRPRLTEILVVANPAGLGLKEEKHNHFVFRVVCTKGEISIDLRLHTAQLRDVEHDADPHDLIRIQALLNYKLLGVGSNYRPVWRHIVGAHYLRVELLDELMDVMESREKDELDTENFVEKVAYLLLDYKLIGNGSERSVADGCTQLMRIGVFSDDEIEKIVEPAAYHIISTVARRVFEEWWAPYPAGLDLPYLMWGFDAAKGLYILEAQGGVDASGEVDWIRIYDLRGLEEKEEAGKTSQERENADEN